MRNYELNKKVVEVNSNKKEDVLEALSFLMDFDNDFIGENGEDYLWDEAREKGFKCNRDYLLHEVSEHECYSDMIEEYITTAMERDNNYYDYTYHESWDNKGNLINIVLVYITEL